MEKKGAGVEGYARWSVHKLSFGRCQTKVYTVVEYLTHINIYMS